LNFLHHGLNRLALIRQQLLSLLLPVLAALTSPAIPLPAMAGEVTVAVAANFTAAAGEIAAAFEKSSGHRARLSFGSTGQIYAQIANGAPFEVFLAADAARPEKAEKQGYAVSGSRFTYATGALVLFSARSGLFDDGVSYLEQGDYKRLAIANPATAPYGLAAQQVLEKLSLWNDIEHKLVRGNSIAQTWQFVATGNAEAGFVALSQLKSAQASGENTTGSYWLVPAGYHSAIEQQAVLLNRGKDAPAAIAFVDFLKSADAAAIIARYGYVRP
jgi:molybdate transport system substrate-binding protein